LPPSHSGESVGIVSAHCLSPVLQAGPRYEAVIMAADPARERSRKRRLLSCFVDIGRFEVFITCP
jgi:hypothetical protein